MRASAAGRVAWNGASADYSISEQTREVAITSAMNFESEVWQAWLERIPSFAFHGRDGQRFTARKETRARGGSYWVAYRKFGGKLTHTYLRMRRKPGKDAMAGYLDRVLAAFPPQSKIDQRALQQPLPEPLSAREQEVLSLLARGASNQEIAETLVVALDTVKRHVSNILSKLAVNNRTQAVVWARALGLLSEEV